MINQTSGYESPCINAVADQNDASSLLFTKPFELGEINMKNECTWFVLGHGYECTGSFSMRQKNYCMHISVVSVCKMGVKILSRINSPNGTSGRPCT